MATVSASVCAAVGLQPCVGAAAGAAAGAGDAESADAPPSAEQDTVGIPMGYACTCQLDKEKETSCNQLKDIEHRNNYQAAVKLVLPVLQAGEHVQQIGCCCKEPVFTVPRAIPPR